MQVVLIRHGHKSYLPPENPPLSEKGFVQAEKLLEKIKAENLPTPTHCYFSQKIRTRQTLDKVIEALHPKIFETAELNIKNNNETNEDFKQRVQNFINKLETTYASKAESVIFICTHYDWIEEAMVLIPADVDLTGFEFSSWSPAQYILFSIEADGLWKVSKKGLN